MRVEPSISVMPLTPPGRGAVATIHVEGPGARQLVERHFTPAAAGGLSSVPRGRIVFGHWNGPVREEIVISAQGPDQLDLHCHGGQVVVDLVLQTLVQDGCRRIDWHQYAAERDDPIRHAARAALAEARTERTASILLDQYEGALGRELHQIRKAIEEGSSAAVESLRDLSRRAGLGRHLIEPWQIVLSGPPNVGKSSLINALIGYQRAIVFHRPGTTRDVVTALTAIDGWPIELADTAGLRVPADRAEAAGVRLAEQRVAEADLIVLVFDVTQPWSPTDRKRVGSLPEAVRVYNKCDLGASDSARPEGTMISARTGEGIAQLAAEIARRIVPDPPEAGAAVPFTTDQINAIEDARVAAHQSDFRGAGNHLRRLATGGAPLAVEARD